jgi:hypothetical protein
MNKDTVFESLLHIAGNNNQKLPLYGLVYFTVILLNLFPSCFSLYIPLFLYSISFGIIHTH